MINFWNAFVKITGWLVQKLCFRTKIYYEDRSIQDRHIHGSAILISNHTSVYDYVVFLFVFISRTLRYQMAEVLFEKKPLGTLLRCLGGIRVDRNTYDFGFISISESILQKGGIVGVFPESRIPKPGELRPLPFKPSTAYLALSSDVPVIPVYTNGSYFNKKRARVMIGVPIYARQYIDENLSEKAQLELVSEKLRERIIELGRKLDEQNK